MIGIGVIGYGYWGPNLVRNFAELPEARVVAVSDQNPARLEAARLRYPAIAVMPEHRALIEHPAVDAVVIATPVATHFELALQVLQAGKHVLVEKPLAASSAQARRLTDEADRRGRVLLVDHTFIYTGAVRKIRALIEAGELGEIYYFDSTRVNLGLFQHDVNVIWDLAVHDLAILGYLLPRPPVAVSATGMGHVPGRPENIAALSLFYDGPLIAHLVVNWLSPVKIRQTLIGGSRQMVVYNDLEPVEKVKVYDRGITLDRSQGEALYQTLLGYRTGDIWIPQIDTTEALRVEAQHFLRCLEGREQPLSGGAAGLEVVTILEAASRSLRARGRPVELDRDAGAAG
jgi:predicted dehydrogenase